MVGLNVKLGIANQSYFGAGLSRATLNLRSRTILGEEMKVIVVGAGITGVSAAEWLRRDGHEVVLIDRVSPGDPMQASYGNCGIAGRSGVVPVSISGLIWQAPGCCWILIRCCTYVGAICQG